MEPVSQKQIEAAVSALDDRLRLMGLHSESIDLVVAPGQVPMVLIEAVIGDLAFSDRVQHPERAETEQQFRRMRVETERELLAELRREMDERRALGYPLFDDEDEDT